MQTQTENLLLLTSIVIGLVLVVAQRLLARQGLFAWTSAGFWAWAAIALYFVLTPLSVISSGDTDFYDIRLAVAGGNERGLWVMAQIVIGVSAFLIVYLRTAPKPIKARLASGTDALSVPMVAVLVLFIGLGGVSLLTYRAGVFSTTGETLIVQGRFVGDVSGYETTGYMFLFMPIMLLVLSKHLARRLIGFGAALAFIIFSLPLGWARYATMSMIIGLTIVAALNRHRRWPPVLLLVPVLVGGAAFQLRGHTAWQIDNTLQSLADTVSAVPTAGSNVLASADTSMLPTFYVESYLKDTWTGYDYSLPAANYLVTGWIPSQIFANKYFLLDWLRSSQSKSYPPYLDNLLFGAKSSLIGSFYSNGGLIAVILEMALMGWLSRRIDGMLLSDNPLLVRALGVSWLSTLWMVWGSHDYWGIMLFGALAIPAIALWVVSPKTPRAMPIINGKSGDRPALNPGR